MGTQYEAKQVDFNDIAQGIIQTLPELKTITNGFLNLARIDPIGRFTIGKVIEYWAKKTPHQTAIKFDNQQWTYSEFNAWANRIAASFQAQGIGTGDVVAILLENSPEVLVCVTAIAKLGAIAAMLNHNQRGEVLEHSFNLVSPKLIVTSADCYDKLASTPFNPTQRSDLTFMWVSADKHSDYPEGFIDLQHDSEGRSEKNPATTRKVKPHQPCYYIFTSGTTGLPKASIMTHYRWGAILAGVGILSMRIRADDVFYCCLPFYHNNALTVSWGIVLSAGATLAIDKKFSASRFWQRVNYYNATAFCYIGELLRYLLNQPANKNDQQHNIRMIVGNGLRPEIWAEFQERFGIPRISEFYGASEANIGFINLFGVSQTAGFTPLPYAIIKFDTDIDEPIRNDKGFMERVDAGETGLLISEVSKARPFDGYTDKAASERKLLRNVFKKGDCWFNSGDLVRDQGWHHIQFVDRVGDTYRWKGENIAASEVESVIASLDTIDHAVAYGVAVPGADGRAGMAAITVKPGCEFDGKLFAQQLFERLPVYAIPLFLRLREEQETTGTFKYRKVELKASGFNPALAADPLYYLKDKASGYLPLTQEVFAQFHAEQKVSA